MGSEQSYYQRLAAAYVRGKLAGAASGAAHGVLIAVPLDALMAADCEALIQIGVDARLRLHRFKRTMELAREHLRRGESFVWNATNITRSLRAPLIELCASYAARVHIVYLDADRQKLLRRNSRQAQAVPEAVIEKLARKLDVPDLTEAHTAEWVWR